MASLTLYSMTAQKIINRFKDGEKVIITHTTIEGRDVVILESVE